MTEKKENNNITKKAPHCPYCDEEVQQAKLPWCKGCGVNLVYCPHCSKLFPSEATSCPHCGSKKPVN